ncbi:MAG: cytochrome-c peroxidase [Flavobacteriales bacterium]|nr:cytochrome-c peroxidase [Flavobacteriales bacterium]
MKTKLFYLLPLSLLIACGGSEEKVEKKEEVKVEPGIELSALQKQAKSLFRELPEIAENSENPTTKEKVALGKKLYFETQLSKDNKISCNSCHNIENGTGVDNLPVSPGNDAGTFGGRNSPTTLNAALHIAQFWDGRAKDVEEQAGGPILNPVEMAMPSEEAVVERLSGIEEYPALFAAAFPEEEKPITYLNLQKAIGAFERTLITPSKLDDFIAGNESALNDQERKGLETFVSVGCVSCHLGNAIGGNMYQKFGVYGDYWEYTKSKKIDEGKFEVSNNEADKYIFKVPTLRNVEKTAPYFHDGSVEKLEDAVNIMAKAQLNKELTPEETNDIVAFLKALSGDVSYE